MAVAAVEQPLTQLCHKLDAMKMDAHRIAGDQAEPMALSAFSQFPINNPPVYLNYAGENFLCNSDMIGDGAGSYCSRDEYPELAYVATPDVYAPPPHGAIYTGCPGPIMNAHGYMPYQMDGMHFYNQIMDYSYGNQAVYGSVPTNVQYPTQVADGFIYGPQVYQYPVQPYYQETSVGQYSSAAPLMSSGGMVVMEPQESGVVLTSGFGNYAAPIPACPPVTFVPPAISCENVVLPITVSYSPHLAIHPSHTLRASAPAWIEPVHEFKGDFKEKNTNEAPAGPQHSAINAICMPSKTGTAAPSTCVLQGGNPTLDVVKAVAIMQPGSSPLMNHQVNKVKDTIYPSTDKVLKDTAFSAVTSSGQEGAMQPKVQEFSKPLAVIPSKDSGLRLPNGDRCNSDNFVTKYNNAKHFIIKSYSEENVFRSIQYGVWASTPNGNKKLDDAYHDARCRAAGIPNSCPVFLFFSVNSSRQFCGVAEMIGPVDYKRSMEFWEQHKWSGSFPLKWHFIKDVPNSQFRRIILQNNENKPVTNSRDTQEVFFQQGLEMLNIIKSYPSQTSILDEFPLCNLPIKVVPDIKMQQQWCPQSFPKLGEHVVKVCNEDSDPKNRRPASTTLKACDNGVKINHPAKQITGKGLPVSGKEPNTEKERCKVDKENIKHAGRDGSLVKA